MTSPQDLQREVEDRNVCSGGLLVLTADGALALIRRAEEERIPILGVDGFLITPEATLSPIEHIADFSVAVAHGNGCWRDAVAHIEGRRHLGLSFEVVLDDPLPPLA